DAAVRAAIRLHLGLDQAGDAKGAAAVLHLVTDRNELHALHLADERLPEVAERATQLAGEGLQHGASLLLRPALVHECRDLPVPGQDVARDVAAEDEI